MYGGYHGVFGLLWLEGFENMALAGMGYRWVCFSGVWFLHGFKFKCTSFQYISGGSVGGLLVHVLVYKYDEN
jgi:hypothetical protein